ncbi:MAG: PAS domain S-box protein, partial [Chloroflexales bacterium]|nr:PAS domain S-box protein [Chloroflexales bacterium]
LEAAKSSAWEWDVAAGTFTYIAQETLPISLPPGQLSCTIDEMIAAVYPPDRPALARTVVAALTEGGAYQFQLRTFGPAGQLHWIDFRGLVQQDSAGRPVRGIGIFQDITAEKRRAAAQILHATITQTLCPDLNVAATLQALARLPLPDLADTCAIYLRDDDDQARPVAAYAGDPAAPVPLMDLSASVALAGEPNLVAAVLRSGTARLLADIPLERGHEPGPPALRSALFIPLAAQDRILGVLQLGITAGTRRYDADDLALAEGLARRGAEALIHARLQETAQTAQQAATEAHARLNALVMSAPNGIGYLDGELRYILLNPALAAINGRPPEAHLGRTPAEVLGRLTPQFETLLKQVLATGAAVHDLELQGKPHPWTGAARDWLVSFFPVPGPEGSVAGVGVTVTDVTTSKRTVAALRASEERFRLLAEHAHDVIYRYRLGPSPRLEYVSPAVERLTGYPREAFYDDPELYLRLAHPDDRAGVDSFAADLAALAQPGILRWQRQDGSTGWAELQSWLVRDEAGRPLAVEGIARDITQRQQAEDALRASQQNLSALIENTDGWIWSVDTQYRLIVANALFQREVSAVMGREAIPGESLVAVDMPQAFLDEWRAHYDRALAGEGFSVEMPTRFMAESRTMEYRLSPIRTDAGAITGVTVFGRDITERLRADQALRDIERKLGTLFAILPVGISILDSANTLAYVNPALEQILGLDQASLLSGSHQARCYLRPDGTPMPIDEYASTRTVRTRQALANVETGIVTETGAVIWTSISTAPVDFPDWRVVIVTTDISARKAAEAQARAALAAEQTARLAAEQASERMARLQALTADLAGALSRDAVIAMLTGHSIAATGAAGAVVSLLDPDSQQLEIIGWAGCGAEELAAFQAIPRSAPVPMITAVQTQAPVWLTSYEEAEARFPGSGAVMAQFGHQAHVTLPLLTPDRVLGVMSFGYPAPNAFAPEERAFLLALAQQCAQALERARLYTEVLVSQERLQHLSERLVAVQEEERRHLARELHDEIGQALSGLSLMLTPGPTLPSDALHAHLAAAQHQVARLIVQVRQRSLDLRPSMLDDLGLHPALVWYLTRYSEQTGIRLDVELQEIEGRFAPLVELTAYRIVQEALTNVARHAGVAHATVLVWVVNAQLMIEVSDMGQGFDLELVRRAYASNGLVGMRERAALLGGELTIESAPGAGTRLFAALPLLRPADATEEAP